MNPRTYTEDENSWAWSYMGNGHRSTGPLYLSWEVWSDPVSDDYVPEETSAQELCGVWAQLLPDVRAEEVFGPGAVTISWYVTGEPFEGAPFPLWRYDFRGDPPKDFLSYFTWPEHTETGERLNFLRLPVVDKLWREGKDGSGRDGRADKGGFLQEATGWKPSPMQPVMWPGPLFAAAGLAGPVWQVRSIDLSS